LTTTTTTPATNASNSTTSTAINMPSSWSKKNQQYLQECVEQMKSLLKAKDENSKKPGPRLKKPHWENDSFMPAIEYLCEIFDLSSFERSLLLMCAATELDSEIMQLLAKLQENPHSVPYPTFSLALAVLPEPHWSALTPTRPLRKYRLIDVLGQPQVPVTRCQLQIDERILHYLVGISYLDKSLRGIVEPIIINRDISIVDSQKQVAETVLHAWKQSKRMRRMFHIQLTGTDETSKKTVASWICRQLGVNLWQLPADRITAKPEDLDLLAALWARESALLNAEIYVAAAEDSEQATQKSVRKLLAALTSPAFVSTRERWQTGESFEMSFDVSKPTKYEQKELWRALLAGSNSIAKEGVSGVGSTSNNRGGEDDDHTAAAATISASKLEREISVLVNQFDFNASSIQSAVTEALLASDGKENLAFSLWSSSLRTARPRLAELASQVTATATMDDLVLPEREKQLLRSIITNIRQRYKVYDEWGFRNSGDRGLGITALFAGDSGTGKTMAAEVMAAELRLDLFKIDLSMVVSKYIGETEKNLRKVFDSAEDGGAILLFDEADALFGKRSEVKDSHDRYSNIEVGYLLQRMEAYRGLAILTTNMKDALDKAFLRRIRFVVNFPQPDEKSRKEIWKRVFPPSVPVVEGIDYSKLAQLDITGGHIRNIALGATFFAAEEGMAVNMDHLRRATKEEYKKMDRAISNSGGVWNSNS
jgi:SpoVK/Ycf46/Vps4 family AAA+-type ATPase